MESPCSAKPVLLGEAVKGTWHLLSVGSEIMALLSTFRTAQNTF